MSLISFSNHPSHSDFLSVVFSLVLSILSRSLSDTYYLFSLKVNSSVVSFSIYQFVPFSFFHLVIFISLSWTYLLHMSFSLFVSISLFIICFIFSFTRLLNFSFIFLFPLLVLFFSSVQDPCQGVWRGYRRYPFPQIIPWCLTHSSNSVS